MFLLNEGAFFFGNVTGVMKYDTNPNFMHYCKGTPPKITIHLHCLIPPQYGSHLMIHGQCSQVSEWGGFGTGRVRYMMGSKVTLLRHHCGIPARFIWNLTKKGTKWDVYIGSTLTQDGIKKTYPYNNIIMSIITCTYVNINKYIYIYIYTCVKSVDPQLFFSLKWMNQDTSRLGKKQITFLL